MNVSLATAEFVTEILALIAALAATAVVANGRRRVPPEGRRGFQFIAFGFAVLVGSELFHLATEFQPQLEHLLPPLGASIFLAALGKFVLGALGYSLIAAGVWKWIPFVRDLAQNVAERWAAEAGLREINQKFSDFVETASDWFWETDERHRFTLIQESAAQATGRTAKEFMGRTREEIYGVGPNDPQWRPFFDTLAARKPFKDFRFEPPRGDGTRRTISISGKPVFAADGRFQGYRGVGHDATEQVRSRTLMQALGEDLMTEAGEDYFRALVRHLADKLEVEIAVVAELVADGTVLRSVARSADGEQKPVEFALAGTAAAEVLEKGVLVCPRGIRARFPESKVFAALGVEGYAGVALADAAGKPMGVLAVTSRKPLASPWLTTAILQAFAPRTSVEMERRRLAAAWRAREERAEKQRMALLRMVRDDLLSWSDPEQALRAITEIASETMEVERTSLWRLSGDGGKIVCRDLFEATPRRHSHGAEIRAEDQPAYFKAIREDRLIDAEDAARDPRTRGLADAYLKPLGIDAILDAGIDVGGRAFGVISFEHVGGRRAWSAEDQTFARALADFVALFFATRERIAALGALAESEARFKSFIEHVPLSAYAKDREGRHLFINKWCCEWHGIDEAGTIGRTNEELYPNRVQRNAATRAIEAEIFKTGQARQVEWEEVLADGRPHVLAGTKFPIFDARGQVTAVGSFVQDVTEQRQAERELRESEARFRSLVENLPHGLNLKDRNARFLAVNRRTRELYGITDDEAHGKTAFDLYPGRSDNDTVVHSELDVVETGQVRVRAVERMLADGKQHSLVVTNFPILDAEGKVAAVGVFVQDVTEQRQAEKELRDSEARFRSVIDHLPIALDVKDRQHRYQLLNKTFAAWYGTTESEALGRTIDDVFRGVGANEEAQRHAEKVIATGIFISRETERVLGDGRLHSLTVTKFPIFDARGQVTAVGSFVQDVTEQKQAEKELRESEARFRGVIDQVPFSLDIKDLNARFLWVNRRYTEFYGLTEEQSRGKTPVELFSGRPVAERAMRQDRAVVETGEVQHREDEWVLADGTTRSIFVTKFPIRDVSGTVRAVGCFVQDITERKQTEKELRDNEARFKSVIDHLPMSLDVKDREHRYLLVNRTCGEWYGLDDATARGKTNDDLFPDRKGGNEASRREEIEVIATGGMRTREIERPLMDGAIHSLAVTKFPIFDAQGAVTAVGSFVRDITRSKKADRELRESAQRYRSLVELSPDAILVLAEGRVVYANPAAVALFGAGSEEYLRVWFFKDLVRPAWRGEMSAYLDSIDEGQARRIIECKLARMDGSTFVAETAASAIWYEGTPALQLVVRDTTQQKEMEAQLVQSAKLATLGEAAAGIIHEMSQPLNIIKLAAEGALMKIGRGAVSADFQKRQFEAIDIQATRMGEIVNHLRIFSRKEMDRKEDFDAVAAVAAAAEMLRSQFALDNVVITTDLPTNPMFVKGSLVQLEQVVVNLLTNARDSILERRKDPETPVPYLGRIAVMAASESAGEGGVSLLVAVADNGGGIPAGTIEKIFEPFFTTKPTGEGTGLGLSICRSIVGQMEGRLSAHNTEDGAVFEIRLPVRSAGAVDAPPVSAEWAAKPEPSARDEATTRDKFEHRVLVVDDEKEAAVAMAQFLENEGYKVQMAHDGEEAYALFVEDPHHLVVTDIRMPKWDGKRLIMALRELDPELPVVIVTGDIGIDTALEPDIRGDITPVLRKPVSPSALAVVAATLLKIGKERDSKSRRSDRAARPPTRRNSA